ncbi:MAG: glycosyltransferase family 4 protein [Methylococcales bacterium]|nr:glycosyltransferase family 4 protein [Methylococcales bacterium]
MFKSFIKNKKTKRVIFFPDWRWGNPYQTLLASGIEKCDYCVDFLNYKSSALLPINSALQGQRKPDIVHLHWLDYYLDALFWSSNQAFVYLRLMLIIIDITLLKIRGIKVVWTVHNLISHESPCPDRELIALKTIARLCHVVVHSEGAKSVVAEKYNINQKKISVAPLGSYVGYYPNDRETNQKIIQKLNLNPQNKTFLFVGAIRRYKGVNELVEAFLRTTNPTYRLVIAGSLRNEDDRQWLEQKAQQDQRIKLSLEFIPENELTAYLNCCDVVVLPFVKTLTSASAILAMSYGKPLILPEIGRVFSMPEEGVIYYSQDLGLDWALEEAVNRDLTAMGIANLQYAQRFTFDKVAKILVDAVYS